jgi:hypothetical protein
MPGKKHRQLWSQTHNRGSKWTLWRFPKLLRQHTCSCIRQRTTSHCYGVAQEQSSQIEPSHFPAFPLGARIEHNLGDQDWCRFFGQSRNPCLGFSQVSPIPCRLLVVFHDKGGWLVLGYRMVPEGKIVGNLENLESDPKLS